LDQLLHGKKQAYRLSIHHHSDDHANDDSVQHGEEGLAGRAGADAQRARQQVQA